MNKIRDFLKNKWEGIKTFLYALLSAAIIYYILELGNKNPFFNGLFFTGINILTVFVVMAAIYFFVQKWWISSLVISIPILCLSVANYYTLLYRNAPISTQDIHNAGTTLSVIGSYKFPINIYVVAIVIFFALSVWVTLILRRREKGKGFKFKSIIAKNLCIIVFGAGFLYSVYFAENPIKPKDTFVWSWEDSYYKYGYAASSIEVFQKSVNMVDRPENYSEERLMEIAKKADDKEETRTPDVIFILNETFYDMRDLIDLSGEPSAMPFIDSLPDDKKGRCVVAGTGGGTNKSEYELLTSNTIQLMPGITPFNYLEFKNSNSAVSHLKNLGYKTWAAHCADSLNYSRGIVYPELGFDEILFYDDFGKVEKYGERPYATDKFCYERMLADYEKMGDAPRFMYLLTIQNHGGWDINSEKEDLVNVSKEFGKYTDDIAEFQSCISLSDLAFKELTEYFENSSREVVICMVGDHAPSFATELLGEIDLEETFALRSTPYVVWSNFEINKNFPDTTSMPLIAPMIFDGAGCKMSPFYQHLAKMQTEIPILTAFGLYKTADGELYNYKDDTPHREALDIYFDMVYNNASPDAKKVEELFKN